MTRRRESHLSPIVRLAGATSAAETATRKITVEWTTFRGREVVLESGGERREHFRFRLDV